MGGGGVAGCLGMLMAWHALLTIRWDFGVFLCDI